MTETDPPTDPQPIQSIKKLADVPGAPLTSTIGFNHSCRACKYNLKGLELSADCPECATPVSYSLSRRFLRYADPVFVNRLRNGARLISIASLLPIVGFCVLMPIGIITSFSTLSSFSTSSTTTTVSSIASPSPVMIAAQALFTVALWLVFMFGWLRLASPEPDSPSVGSHSNDLAWTTKLVIAIAALMILASIVPIFSVFSESTAALTAVTSVSSLTQLIAYALLIVQFVFGIRIVKAIARRVPAEGLRKFATVVFWFAVSSIALMILQITLLVVGLLLLGVNPQSLNSATAGGSAAVMLILFGLTSAAVALSGFAAYVMYIILFCRLWSYLSKACRLNALIEA